MLQCLVLVKCHVQRREWGFFLNVNRLRFSIDVTNFEPHKSAESFSSCAVPNNADVSKALLHSNRI